MAVMPLRFEPDGTPARPAVQVVQVPALDDARLRADLVQALRQVLQGYWFDRLVIAREHRDRIEALLERADDAAGSPLPYRLDDLTPERAHGVLPNETVLVLHVDTVDPRASAVNGHGRWVAHWLFGGTLEQLPGRWPFMHEHQARAYPGHDGLNQWLYEMSRFSSSLN